MIAKPVTKPSLPAGVAAEARYKRQGITTVVRIPEPRDPFEICNAVAARIFPGVQLQAQDKVFDSIMAARNARARQVPEKDGNAMDEPGLLAPAAAATALPGAGVRDTSVAAYRALHWSGKLTEQQQLVLQAFDGKQQSWTRQELARATGLGINVICGRVNELLHEPIEALEECGKRRCSVTGETVHVLRRRAAMEKAA